VQVRVAYQIQTGDMKPDPYMTTFDIVMKYLGILMATVYVSAGITVLFRSHELFNIPKPYILPLGISLTGYGIFRSYRLYQKYFKRQS
jgi:hypothetical protein